MTATTLQKSGSLPGAILLITGCCIGAGMLGLPVMSALTGFKPSLAMFFVSWLFMVTTALLLLEVNLWFKDEVSIISMADRTLGFFGKAVGWSCFAFLFYALGIAYISGSGELLASFIADTLKVHVPNWVGSVLVSALFGICVYLGTRAVDLLNRLLMIGLIATYVILVLIGAPHVNKEYLMYQDWSLASLVLPIMIISFGFHNLVPSLTSYLNGDVKRLRLAIICGSAIPLIIYLVWEWLILGLVPSEGRTSFLEVMEQGNMATEILKNATGTSSVLHVAEYFAFFAIVTSFLGNSLSFVDFLADGLRIKKTAISKVGLCALVIIPPLLLSIIYPNIFLSALNYAGAFGAMLLFGVLPALMVWSGRYYKKLGHKPIVPGGKITLVAILLFSAWVIGLQLYELISSI